MKRSCENETRQSYRESWCAWTVIPLGQEVMDEIRQERHKQWFCGIIGQGMGEHISIDQVQTVMTSIKM
jgi:hypothetical protein